MNNRFNPVRKKGKALSRHEVIVGVSAVFGIIVVSVAAVFVVRAFLTDFTQKRENEFASITYTNIDIVEPGGKTYTVSLDLNNQNHYVSGNGTVTKDAQIKNLDGEDKKPVYLRIKTLLTVYDADGNNVTLDYCFGSEPVSLQEPAYLQQTADWYKGTDGYYYYKHIMVPGQTTDHIFPGNATDGYKATINNAVVLPDNAHVHIDILADAVQAVSTDTVLWTAADYYTAASIGEVQTAWGMTPSPASVSDDSQKVTTTCGWSVYTP